jgi:LacI family transcriptional regulator
MRVGIREVAELAGVSPSTVSRVLNEKIDRVQMSAATIERIRNAAATLNYRPNAAARSLRTTQAQTIGVIARNLLHPFIAGLLGVISGACRSRGYHLLLGHAEHSSTEGGLLGDILSADRVDGVLLLGDLLPAETRRADMERLIRTHQHVVTVGAHPSVAGEHAILVDNERGVSLALEHLVTLGHRSIGYVGESSGPESWEDLKRRASYRAFLGDRGLPQVEGAEVLVTGKIASIQVALRSLLSLPDPPSALFVGNDLTALLVIKAALSCGIRVPGDLSVVGFDDLPYSALVTPALTTVRQPIDAMGYRAATSLLDLIGNSAPAIAHPDGLPESCTEIYSPTLVCRDSTGVFPK